ncbi:MAG: hypothetical protein LWW94_09995 [Candidatus Desulfofervidaceae bacterium]|nr:hypothetical protein [Candidatus Desulfofervidaceae bacterium]
MEISIEIENIKLAKKILAILSLFREEGLKIKEVRDSETEEIYSKDDDLIMLIKETWQGENLNLPARDYKKIVEEVWAEKYR